MAEEKKLGDLNRTEKQAIILQALMKEGYNQNQASKLLEVSRVRVCQVNKKIKAGVLNPLVNKAKKSVALLLEGKPVGDMTQVRGADVLQAAKMVLDRADPVINKTENTNVSIQYEIKPEERDRYKAALGIIDAEFELISEQKLLTEGSNNGSSPGFEPEDESPILSPSTNNMCGPHQVLEDILIISAHEDEEQRHKRTIEDSQKVQDSAETGAHHQHG